MLGRYNRSLRFTTAVIATAIIAATVVLWRADDGDIGEHFPSLQENGVWPQQGLRPKQKPGSAESGHKAPPRRGENDAKPASRSTVELDSRYTNTDDYFDFVRSHAAAAYAGDSRLQYYLWNAVLRCEVQIGLYKIKGDGDVQRGYEQQVRESASAPEWVRLRDAREFKKCAGFIDGDPFKTLPSREEGYGWRYWRDRSLEAKEPLALLKSVVEGTAKESDSRSQKDRQDLLRTLDIAARSNDPVVYLVLGSILQNPAVGADPVDGLAWAMAACDMGYDCRQDNPRVGFGCVETGGCASGVTLSDRISADAGADALAVVYARAQAIHAFVEAKDYASLAQYLRVKPKAEQH